MSNDEIGNEKRDDVVPFFKSDKNQIIFEFFYLIVTFWLATTITILIHFKIGCFAIDHHSKVLLFAVLGGLLMQNGFIELQPKGKTTNTSSIGKVTNSIGEFLYLF